MFMAYLVLGSLFFVVLGMGKMKSVFDLFAEWPHALPSLIFVLTYVLSLTLSIAVSIMLWWHLRSVMCGETSVESHDYGVYRAQAGERGEVFVNSYDLGKRRNLELFFNIGPTGYTAWTLLLPLKTLPYTDGWSWARKEGSGSQGHVGVGEEDEITDDEGEEV